MHVHLTERTTKGDAQGARNPQVLCCGRFEWPHVQEDTTEIKTVHPEDEPRETRHDVVLRLNYPDLNSFHMPILALKARYCPGCCN